MVVFDPDKDKANLAKHGVSLDRASILNILARIVDDRYSEPRFRAYGTIDGVFYCLAYVIRDGKVRAISLRRAHLKEIKRYANR
jgi:uncharacterized DUF497 family protein